MITQNPFNIKDYLSGGRVTSCAGKCLLNDLLKPCILLSQKKSRPGENAFDFGIIVTPEPGNQVQSDSVAGKTGIPV